MFQVALIFGIAGACRRDELYKLEVNDVEDVDSAFIVRIPDSKTHVERNFVVSGKFESIDLLSLCRKYSAARSAITGIDKFFVCYRNGKCIKQVVGINMFGKMPGQIAEYLGLKNPKEYTGHCLRRTSATFLVDSGGDILTLKRHRGWKYSSVAEGYVEDSIGYKRSVANRILVGENSTSVKSFVGSCVGSDSVGNHTTALGLNSTQCSKEKEGNTVSNRPVPDINIQNCNNCTINITLN